MDFAKLLSLVHRIDLHFLQMEFIRSSNEPTVYRKLKGSSNILLLCLHADDMIYMGSFDEMLIELKENMMKMFEISDLGPLRYFLGLEVRQLDGSLFVSQ